MERLAWGFAVEEPVPLPAAVLMAPAGSVRRVSAAVSGSRWRVFPGRVVPVVLVVPVEPDLPAVGRWRC